MKRNSQVEIFKKRKKTVRAPRDGASKDNMVQTSSFWWEAIPNVKEKTVLLLYITTEYQKIL